jgi:CRISPR system Cascade subunit CasD
MPRHLVLRLDAPLVAFGGETIDNHGVIRPFPAKSMIAGLIANALGLERHEYDRLQALQDGLIFGSRVDRQDPILRDFQTAKLSKNDQGWTTYARLEGRSGGPGSYSGPHLRYRDYWTDAVVHVVFRLLPEANCTLEGVQAALLHPARALFVGRKSCLPSGLILNGAIDAASIFDALMALCADKPLEGRALFQWPVSEGPVEENLLPEFGPLRREPICDERNWLSGVHGGQRLVDILELKQNLGA